MEDLSIARFDEASKSSGLQAEWLENEQSGASKSELAFAVTQAEKQQKGPGKDVADRLDRELRDYADSTIEGGSRDILAFQKMIDKFCNESDKKKAIQELGESYSRLRVQMGKEMQANYEAMQEEGAKQPGRKEIQADFESKLHKFFDKADESKNRWDIYELIEWKEGESLEAHRARIREGLKDNKELLGLYNKMEDASDVLEANKSPKEKELENRLDQERKEYRAMEPVVNKAYIRSTIEY